MTSVDKTPSAAGARARPSYPTAPAPCRQPFTRSVEPVFWSLFGGGGMTAAMLGPALVLVTLLLAPLGLGLPPDTLSYARVLAFVQWWPGALALLGIVVLLLFHAAHRFSHSLHDVGISIGCWAPVLSYGAAAVFSVVCAALLWRLQGV